jgi:hypothetical protein
MNTFEKRRKELNIKKALSKALPSVQPRKKIEYPDDSEQRASILHKILLNEKISYRILAGNILRQIVKKNVTEHVKDQEEETRKAYDRLQQRRNDIEALARKESLVPCSTGNCSSLTDAVSRLRHGCDYSLQLNYVSQ